MKTPALKQFVFKNISSRFISTFPNPLDEKLPLQLLTDTLSPEFVFV